MVVVWLDAHLGLDVASVYIVGEETGASKTFTSTAGGDSHEANDDHQHSPSVAKVGDGHSWQD